VVADDDYCYLTTTGRRTGRPHRIEIWYAIDGSTLYLLAGGGRSADWVQNLMVDPSALLEVDGMERPVLARVLTDDQEAERARQLVYGKYAPRSDGDLSDWRDRPLPVALDAATP